MNIGSEEIPPITIDEIYMAIKEMELNRASKEDGIIPELIRYRGKGLKNYIKILLNKCLDEKKKNTRIMEQCNTSSSIQKER